MNKAYKDYSISELCKALDVSASTYYYPPIKSDIEEERVVVALKTAFEDSDQTYGKRRLRQALHKQGHTVGITKVRTLMKKHGLKAVIPKKKHYYPDAGNDCKYAPNLLARQFNPVTVGIHLVGDITYIRSYEGWYYLALSLIHI